MRRTADHGQWCDLDLLQAIAACDREAFVAFYRRHLGAVLAFLVRETGDGESAADLTAEVFAAVSLSARRYRPQHETAAPWLIGIARNVLRESRRHRRVEDRARRRLGFEPVELTDADLERVDAIVDDEHGRVRGLMELLPADERHAVQGRVVEERGYDELASELRCSEMVVRKRVSRGLARLREWRSPSTSVLDRSSRTR